MKTFSAVTEKEACSQAWTCYLQIIHKMQLFNAWCLARYLIKYQFLHHS